MWGKFINETDNCRPHYKSTVVVFLLQHELKPEWPVLKNAGPILRCFKRALELDESNSKLWIEYGSLAYELHSFASRQLKLVSLIPIIE